MSHEINMPQGRRPFHRSNATRAMPIVRGVVALPGSKNTSRAKGMHRKLGDPASDQWHEYALVRIGKVRTRSR